MEIYDYNFDLNEIMQLYEKVGWTNYCEHPDLIAKAFAGSLCVLAAYEDGKLAGVIRAVGDGASILYIQDIAICPGMQRKGVGTALVRALLGRFPSVYQTVLMTDDVRSSESFYKSLGFSEVSDINCKAFVKLG